MRHKVSGFKLGRNSGQRTALLRNLSSDLITRGYIVTTQTKAKFAQSFVEKAITDTKKNRLYLRRQWASTLTGPAFLKLINEIAPGFDKRQSGYTRIIRAGIRKGDAAQTARLEILSPDKIVTQPKLTAAKKPKPKKLIKPKKTTEKASEKAKK